MYLRGAIQETRWRCSCDLESTWRGFSFLYGYEGMRVWGYEGMMRVWWPWWPGREVESGEGGRRLGLGLWLVAGRRKCKRLWIVWLTGHFLDQRYTLQFRRQERECHNVMLPPTPRSPQTERERERWWCIPFVFFLMLRTTHTTCKIETQWGRERAAHTFYFFGVGCGFWFGWFKNPNFSLLGSSAIFFPGPHPL